jgi:hypothetical protein
MTEDRLCGLAMIHVHRNDAVGQVIPEAVLKRRDSSGNRKIHLAFTDSDKLTLESNWKMTIFNVHGKPMKLSHKHFAVVYMYDGLLYIVYSRNKRYTSNTKLYGKSST